MIAPPKTEFNTKNFNDRPPRVVDAKKAGVPAGVKRSKDDPIKEFGGRQAPTTGKAAPPQKL